MSTTINDLPKRGVRLAAGVRLLNPFTGTYYKYGGRFVHADRWTDHGQVVVSMTMGTGKRAPEPGVWARTYFLVSPEAIGLKRQDVDVKQLSLFEKNP